MIEHLKIKNFKVIEEATLLNLGKINIICGKNNSGKSTLLSGIDSNRIIGKTLKIDKLGYFSKIPRSWFPRGGSTMSQVSLNEFDDVTGIKNFNEKYFKVLEKLIINKEIWFSDENYTFANEFEKFSPKVLRKNIFEKIDVEISETYIKEFKDDYKTVIIPSKRWLEPKCNYAGHGKKKIHPNGDNLLSELYWLKNQPKQTPHRKFYENLSRAFQEVSDGHIFNITPDGKDELFLRFAYKEHDEIEADDCGLGLHDLLVILYFALSEDYQIILIEEPENHMHPEMQRKLLRFLKEETDKQYFITTHSNIFLSSLYVDRVFFTEFKEDEIKVSDATSRAKVLHSLGYAVTDNLVSDLIIIVEGSGDKDFIEEFLSKLKLDTDYNIKIWILGGDEMINQDLSVFKQDYEVIALVDKDSQSEKNRTEFEKHCKDYGITFHKLERYSIESYFSVKALNETFNKYNNKLPEINGLDDAQLSKIISDKPIWARLGKNEKRIKELKTRIKRKVREVAREMTLNEIKGTDLSKFFDKIKEILNKLSNTKKSSKP